MSDKFEVYDFGLTLKKLRIECGFTQEFVAERLDVKRNTISNYENNTQTPPIDKLKLLAGLYNTSTDFILGLNKKKPVYLEDLSDRHKQLVAYIIQNLRNED